MADDIYYLSGESFITRTDLSARIAELEDMSQEDFDNATAEADASTLMSPMDELETLREFRQKAGRDVHNFVNDDYWATFAADEAESLYGPAATNSGFWDHDRWSAYLSQEYASAVLTDGSVFRYRAV